MCWKKNAHATRKRIKSKRLERWLRGQCKDVHRAIAFVAHLTIISRVQLRVSCLNSSSVFGTANTVFWENGKSGRKMKIGLTSLLFFVIKPPKRTQRIHWNYPNNSNHPLVRNLYSTRKHFTLIFTRSHTLFRSFIRFEKYMFLFYNLLCQSRFLSTMTITTDFCQN